MKKIKETPSFIKKLSPLLEEREEVKFAYLFGSRALGYYRPDSDIDLAVLFDEETSTWAEVNLEEELSRRMGVPVQVVSLSEGLVPRLLQNILAKGAVVKDGFERGKWEEKAWKALREEMKMESERDYKGQLLDSIEEKARAILKALPLLDKIDLEKVKRDEPEAVRDFLGVFLMLFEPLEAIVRKIPSYARLALDIGEEPATLREQTELMLKILDLDDKAFERFGKLARLRNRIANAYWKLAEEELSSRDLEETKEVLERFADKLSAFITLERGKLS